MSALDTKIQSYSPEVNIEFDTAYALNPPNTGSISLINWSQNNTVPIASSTGGPTNGSGYWTISNTTRFRNSTTALGSALLDHNYVVGFWFRCPSLPTGSLQAARPIVSVITTSNAIGFDIAVSGTGFTSTAAPSKLHLRAASTYEPFGATLVANTWYYVAVVRENQSGTGNYKVYLNGALALTTTNTGTSGFSSVTVGSVTSSAGESFDISNLHIGTTANFTPTAIAEIYTAGAGSPSTNYNFNASAATASATAPDSTQGAGTTTTETPATASAEQVEPLIVSASSDIAANVMTASSLMVDPNITAVDGNSTQTWTSVTVSALFVDAQVTAQRNIITTSDVMTASAEAGDHVGIGASTILFNAENMLASITSVDPIYAGSGDKAIVATALLVSNAVLVDPTIVVPMSYDTLVLQGNPIFFINDGNESNPPPVNKGSKNFGLIDLQTQWEVLPSGSPMAAHGEGTSWYTDSGDTNSEMYIFNADAAQAIKDMHLGSGFTYEFWWKPLDGNYDIEDDNNDNVWIYDGYLSFNLDMSDPGNWTYIQLFINNDTPDYYHLKTYNSVWINPDYPTYTKPAGNYSHLIPLPTKNVWHHMVVTGSYSDSPATITTKVYIDGSLISSWGGSFTRNTTAINTKVGGVRTNTRHGASSHYFDQFAIYDRAITASEVADHYSYIWTNDGSKTIGNLPYTVDARSGDHSVLTVINLDYPETPATASSEIVQPTILTTTSITLSATVLTASANSVAPTVDTVYSINLSVSPFISSANMPGGFTPSEAFATYVKALSPAPYRYHNLDDQNEWVNNDLFGISNDGTDAVYSLDTHLLGEGTHVRTTGVINNYSVLSTLDWNQQSYPKSLVVYESEYNDDWGTTFNNTGDGWTLSFCVRAHKDHPANQGMVVLASGRSYVTTDNFLIYHHNNKLNVELKHNGTIVSYETPSNVNLFNFVKHQITMTLHRHSTNSHTLDLYVDGISVLSQVINNNVPVLLQSNTVQGPNTTNWAKVALGGLLSDKTEYNFFTNNNENPQYSKLYFDEFIWLKWDLNATQALALFNALPVQADVDYLSTPKTASALLVEPTLSLGTTKTATALQAINGIIVDPVLYYDKEVSVGVVGTATATMTDATISFITHINVNATPLTSFADLMSAVFIFSVTGGPMVATVKAVNSPLYFDPYNLLIMTQSYNTSSSMTTFGGRWGIGDH